MSEQTSAAAPSTTTTPAAVEAAKIVEGASTSSSDTPVNQNVGEFSSKFAALAKREKKILDQLNELKATKGEVDKINSLRSKVKENPLSLLDEFGITMEQLLTSSLGADAPAEEVNELDLLRKEIEAIKRSETERLDADRKAREDADNARIEEAITSHKLKIQDTVSKEPDKFELITLKGEDGLDLIWQVTETYWEQQGRVLSPDEAAMMVENYLEDEAKKLFSVKKLGAKIEPKVNQSLTESHINPFKQGYTTLTQELQTSPQSKAYAPVDLEESKARAAAMLRWI
jgi:hypothetical protein